MEESNQPGLIAGINKVELNAITLAENFGITVRQAEVAICICNGMKNKQIAEHFGFSVAGAKGHIRALFAKFGFNNRGDLITKLTGQDSSSLDGLSAYRAKRV